MSQLMEAKRLIEVEYEKIEEEMQALQDQRDQLTDRMGESKIRQDRLQRILQEMDKLPNE